MAKELFNQTIASLNYSKRLAFGQPGQNGCDNIVISDFVDEVRGIVKLGEINSTYSGHIDLVDCSLIGINIKYVSGSGNIKIGSSAGAEDLLNAFAITEHARIAISQPVYAAAVYVTLTGSLVAKVTLVFEKELF